MHVTHQNVTDDCIIIGNDRGTGKTFCPEIHKGDVFNVAIFSGEQGKRRARIFYGDIADSHIFQESVACVGEMGGNGKCETAAVDHNIGNGNIPDLTHAYTNTENAGAACQHAIGDRNILTN